MKSGFLQVMNRLRTDDIVSNPSFPVLRVVLTVKFDFAERFIVKGNGVPEAFAVKIQRGRKQSIYLDLAGRKEKYVKR